MGISFGPIGEAREVQLEAGGRRLNGTLGIPPQARGLVLFAHGSGSSRFSSRNRHVAQVLRNAGIATLLFDLLTKDEEAEDEWTGHLRFNIPMLANRLTDATDWVLAQPETRELPIGYFGASTGGGAALVAAAERPSVVRAVVSRGGRPDLAGEALRRVEAPTLLIVGGDDEPVIGMNQAAMAQMHAKVELTIVPGATHLFEEPGTLDEVARLATNWFRRYLSAASVTQS
ncbi:MAG TPA: alpha/beta family hydrolase [Oscillatoriaceae cyanobacterium]